MYEEKTFENIMESMFARLPESMDKREGSIIYDATAAVAYHLAESYYLLENYIDLVMPDTSAGEYLNRYAEVFNLFRKEATRAVRQGSFDCEIPIGSRFSTSENDGSLFIVKKLLNNENGTFLYEMECEKPGKLGNEYEGDLIPVEYISGLGVARLGAVLSAGTDEETDESLRQRLFSKVQKPSTSGNANDYYNWAMACAGIGAAKVFPLAEGPGTVKVVVAGEDMTAADDTLVKNTADYIETVRPIGAAVTVVSAVEKTINISVRVRLTTETSLGNAQSAFAKEVDRYLQENAFCSAYVSLARMGSLLMEIPGVEDFEEMKLNGKMENIVLKEEEIAVCGAVRLEVI